jgi:hypothetical protein
MDETEKRGYIQTQEEENIYQEFGAGGEVHPAFQSIRNFQPSRV